MKEMAFRKERTPFILSFVIVFVFFCEMQTLNFGFFIVKFLVAVNDLFINLLKLCWYVYCLLFRFFFFNRGERSQRTVTWAPAFTQGSRRSGHHGCPEGKQQLRAFTVHQGRDARGPGRGAAPCSWHGAVTCPPRCLHSVMATLGRIFRQSM